MKKFLVSSALLPKVFEKPFYEFQYLPLAYNKLEVEGLELVFLPEWECKNPPLTPTSANWYEIPKVSVNELVTLMKNNHVPVPSVHLNRDIPNYLCSADAKQVERGQRLLDENLSGAVQLGSEIGVLHLWDTYKVDLNFEELLKRVTEVTSQYKIKIAYENIPISDKLLSVEKVFKLLYERMPAHHGFTLDLNWCSFYENFNELKGFINRIMNIHVQGYIEENYLKPKVGHLDILYCLKEMCKLNYQGYITLEMNKAKSYDDFKKALNLVKEFSAIELIK